MNLVQCIISRRFMRDKKYDVVLYQILETPLLAVCFYSYFFYYKCIFINSFTTTLHVCEVRRVCIVFKLSLLHRR